MTIHLQHLYELNNNIKQKHTWCMFFINRFVEVELKKKIFLNLFFVEKVYHILLRPKCLDYDT